MAGTTTYPEQGIATNANLPDRVALSEKALRKNGIFVGDANNPNDKTAIAAFKQLRTQVLAEMDALDVRTVLVTGPTQGLGKSTISLNLAYSIARMSDQKAVVIDLDLRGSCMQATLGTTLEYGSDRIGDDDFSLVRASYYLGNERLLVLPAARRLDNSSEVLMSDIARKNLGLLRKFQNSCYVIYDAPPVLGCDDVAALAPHMDCAILVVEEGKTSRSDIVESMKILGELPVIATVLNKSNDKKIQQYYY